MSWNTIVVDKIEDLDASQIKPADQFLIYEKYHDDFSGKILDNITTLILSTVMFNCIYVFRGTRINPCVNINDDLSRDSNDIEIVSCSVSTKEYLEYYLCIDGKNLIHITENNPFKYDKDVEFGTMNYSTFHRPLFETEWIQSMAFTNDFDHHVNQFLAIKLDEDNCLVLNFTHDIENECFKWKVNREIYIINRNKQYAKLRHNIVDLFNRVKEASICNLHDVRTFEKYMLAFHYNIENYLKDPHREKSVQLISDLMPDYIDIKEFFKPLYADTVNGKILTAYPKSLKNGYNDIFFLVDGVDTKYWDIEAMGLKRHHKVAHEVCCFYINGKNGLNPIDGGFYEYGHDISDRYVQYKDDAGVILLRQGEYSYYVKELGYYIEGHPVVFPLHKELIEGLNYRYMMYKKMANKD